MLWISTGSPPTPFFSFCLKTCDSYVSWCAHWHTLAHAFAWILDPLCVMKADLTQYKRRFGAMSSASQPHLAWCALFWSLTALHVNVLLLWDQRGTIWHSIYTWFPQVYTSEGNVQILSTGAGGSSRVFFQVKIKFGLHHDASAIAGQRCTMHIKPIKLKSPSSPWLGPNFPVGTLNLLKTHHLNVII